MDSKREQQMSAVQSEALELFSKKNTDYGDAFADYGPIGVIVRMGDKIRRLQNITKNSVSFVKDESIRDTLIDLHNYAAMAVMLLDEDYTEKGLQISDELTELIESDVLHVSSSDDTVDANMPPPPPRNLYRQLTEQYDLQVLDPNEQDSVAISNSVDL